jgi:hypothetical protein
MGLVYACPQTVASVCLFAWLPQAKEFEAVDEDIQGALEVSAFLWPGFKRASNCVLLAWVGDAGIPAQGFDLTGWEAFQNHTHLNDDFLIGRNQDHTLKSDDDREEDWKAARKVGQLAAKLWCLKLREDFPEERFRVYYTESDDCIIRFHKVREGEPPWASNADIEMSKDSFESSLVYDTENPTISIKRR